MSRCFYDDDAVCINIKSPETFGKRCIEADNLLKNEQTYCRCHIEKANPDEVLSNEICLYLFNGKCANALCLQHGKSCPRNSGEECGFFIPEHKFKKKNDHEAVKSDQTDFRFRTLCDMSIGVKNWNVKKKKKKQMLLWKK